MNRIARVSPASIARVAALVALAPLVALAAVQPAPAAGQSSAVREQYDLQLDSERSTPAPPSTPSTPQPSGASAPPGGQGEGERIDVADPVRTAALTGARPPTGAASGELPVGGYPLTPFLLLLLALLLGGLALRVVLAIRDRLRRRYPGPPGGAP